VHLVAAALALAVAAAGPAAVPPPAAVRDPFGERYAAAVKELERDRRLPRAIVPLARLHELEGEAPDLSRIARSYAQAAQDPRALPEIRALARYRLAELERSRGNVQKAAAEARRLGFLRGWQLVGPFDNEGKRGFDAVFPPEEGQDLAARYPGKAREIGWRPAPPEAEAMGFLALGAVLRPARDATAYALAVVEAPREQRAQLWIGASGAFKVWVNGSLALADPGYHPARLDQAGAWVTLRRGPNRILVKLCHEAGEMGLYARLADATGGALALAPVVVPPLPAPARGERAERIDGVVKALERWARAAKGEEEGRARMDLAIALWERRGDDARERRAAEEARRAAALLPRSVEAWLLAARLEEDDPNRRRAHLETAAALDPSNPEAIAALAAGEMRRGRPVAAVRLLERAAAAAPGFAPARVALAQAMEQVGLGARAELDLLALARSLPTSPGAVGAAARAARRLDRVDEAASLFRKALALRHDDEASRAMLSQLLVDRGDVEGALELGRAALRLAPSDVFLRLRIADLLSANGLGEDAETAYAAAARICPEEPEIWERRGHARLRAGRTSDAVADFQRSLELRPQNPQLKELVRQIEPSRENFERPYFQDARVLAAAAPGPKGDEDALVLSELKVTRVFPSGLSATYLQLVVKVFDARGVEAFRSHPVSYAPDRQELRVDRARVLKPDGTVVETRQETERSLSEPWYRLYYDTRARTVTFPSLAPGDVLEVAWRIDDVAGENLLSDYFGDLTHVQDATRKVRFDYVLLLPEGRKIHANDPGLPGLERTERALGGGVAEHRWTARDLPRLEPEPGMPGWTEVSPYVHVSTYADWKEVAAFYWGLLREPLRPNAEVREVAQRIAAEARARAKGAKDADVELAIVRAVHDFVVTSIRYVGLEFGIHGYKPYRVDQVLTRRFGDCKDKASLAHALLESVGIDSRIVLLRMRRLGRVAERPASLAVFNHAILYVPKYRMWLDGTASYAGSRELPGEDRGAIVLVVNPGEAPEFGTVPGAAPGENRTDVAMDVAVSADGGAVVKGESRVAGEKAASYRRSYQAESGRRAAFEQAWSRAFPGLEVKELAVSDLARIEEDVSLRFTLDVRRYARKDGDGLRFTPFGQGQTFAETYAALSARRFDLVLGEPWENRFTYRHLLPAGWGPSEVPEPVTLDTPFGALEVRYREEGGALVAEGRIAFKAARVGAADYPAFRDFVSRVDRAMARTVRVGPAAARAATR
jgi:tetratricopeptide (TPR) repeat protein